MKMQTQYSRGRVAWRVSRAAAGVLAVLAGLALTVPAQAGGLFQGKANRLLFNAGATAARVSIYVGAGHASACPSGLGVEWMAYENADAGIGKSWTAALLAARAVG